MTQVSGDSNARFIVAKKKKIRTRRGLKEYTYLGCPLTRNNSAWCYRLCQPDAQGHGRCGRLAPHGLKSRIQQSIEDHGKKLLAEHCEKLEHMYLTAPCNAIYDPGIDVAEGKTEIIIPVQETFFHAAGAVHNAVYFKALDDAAFLAVNSVVRDCLVLTANFNTYLSRPIDSGRIIARGIFMGQSDNQFYAESVLTNSEGNELGRGNGMFLKSEIPLAPEIGYE